MCLVEVDEMKKKLITCEADWCKFVVNLRYENCYGRLCKFSKGEIEELLGIRFIRSNGKIPMLLHESFWTNEFYAKDLKKFVVDEDLDYEYAYTDEFIYAKYATKPRSYPCVVLYSFERSFDRCGDTSTDLLQFVYLKEFR